MPSSEVEILLARKYDADSMSCRIGEKSQHYFFSLFKLSSRSKIGLLYFFTQKIIFPGDRSGQEFETGPRVDEKLD